MNNKVLDFVGKRIENIEQKRRNFERVLFQNMLGAYTVIESNNVVYPIELIDLSKNGCQFKIPETKKTNQITNGNGIFSGQKEITLRMYFTGQSFIPVSVKIRHIKHVTDEKTGDHILIGGEFDTSTHSFEAMKAFIEFLYKFAENSVIDTNEVKSYFY